MAKKSAKKSDSNAADKSASSASSRQSPAVPEESSPKPKRASARVPAVKDEAKPASSKSGRRAPVIEEVTAEEIAKAVDEGTKSSLSQRISLKSVMVEMSRGKEPIKLHHRALTKTEVRDLRAVMVERLKLLTSDVEQMEEDMLSSDSATRAGTDMVDQSSAQYEQEFKLQRVESEATEIALIRRAIAKIDGRIKDMEYGRCEATGLWISIERLKAIPHARLCIAAVERFEREGGGEEFGIKAD